MLTGLALMLASPTTPWQGPAFLDRFDQVTLWVPQAAKPEELNGQVQVMVDGRTVQIAEIIGREPARPSTDPDFVVIPGSLQQALGANPWDPAGTSTRMRKVGEGIFELAVKLPAGRYEYKVARGGSWNENYGVDFAPNGANVVLIVPSAQLVGFRVDFNQRRLRDSINHPTEVPTPTAPTPPYTPSDDKYAGRFQSFSVRLAAPLQARDISRTLRIQVGQQPMRPIIAREVLNDPQFFYRGFLGAQWTPRHTTFTAWSPVSREADLDLFDKATGERRARIPMQRGPNGTWTARVNGNLDGTYYQYRFHSYGRVRTAADIYGRAASADSSRSMVINLARTNPPGWPLPRLFVGQSHADAVLYELHVRDFTIHPSSGVKPEWRGKYLGFTQTGTTVPGTNQPTGLDYLKRLGVTHVHILPIQDFNPAHSEMYNWGYETTLFDVPEEQYALNRNDAAGRIRETKQMVQALQRAGIGVILDVVYNHTVPSQGELSAFWETVPYFWFRTNDRGDVLNESGVGNALNDDNAMARDYVVRSLDFWTREYRIDGYRFDLVGMFTRESNIAFVNAIRRANPHAVIYGEPWTGGGPIRFGKGAQRSTGMAVFNDRFRGAFRGELDGAGPGFGMGGNPDRGALWNSMSGHIDDFTDSPLETVNYVSSHDNLTFWDKVALSMPQGTPAQRAAAVRFGHAAVMLAQGMPFIEGGIEIGRTKNGNPNSYNAGDEANQYRWDLAPAHAQTFEYLRGLIALRRAHVAFRQRTSDAVRRVMKPIEGTPDGVYAFRLDGRAAGDTAAELVVILNGSMQGREMDLPAGRWNLIADGTRAGTAVIGTWSGRVNLEPQTAYVLRR